MKEAQRFPTAANRRGREAKLELVQRVAELALDRKARDLVVLDIGNAPETSQITDFFVICTGRSDVHVHAICKRIVEGMRQLGSEPLSAEGVERGHWALLDYGDVVVHVFQDRVRGHYDLERLWTQAPRWTYADGSDIDNGPV